MEKRTMELIEEVSSQGIWTWLEFDDNSNSLYLEFKNLKLADTSISSPFEYKDDLVIRFGNNLFLSLFYNNVENLDFLNIGKHTFNEIFYHNKKLSNLDTPYFFTEFSKELTNLKFQDYALLKEIASAYKNNKILIQNLEDQNYDFLLILECDDVAIAVGCDFVNTFNASEALTDDDIKRLSNKWILYYLDYWDKKGTEDAYVKDALCEEVPFNKCDRFID